MKKTTLSLVMASLCLIFTAKAQQTHTLKGKVTTSDQQPLPGATVKHNKTTALTNQQGRFEISTDTQEGIINVSYTGYKSKEINFKNISEPLIITLEEDNSNLKEVEINAGYYTVKDKERTGNITRITAATIEKQPVNNPLLALQGRVAGMEIIQASGIPGSGVKVRIRGQNSLSSGNDPLYIVNGVPFPSASMSSSTLNLAVLSQASPLSVINPSDIESIEILKDADATAIYGSRGANGVVLITTKTGKAGATKFDVNFYQGMGDVAQRMKLLNTEQYIEMRKEGFKNDGTTPPASAYDINGTWDQSRYTDWQEILFGGTANSTNAQVSVSGGSQQTTFLLSGNYYRETNVFPGNKRYKKNSSLLNVNHQSTDQKFKLAASVNYNIENNALPTVDIATSIRLAPNAPVALTPDGQLNWENGTFRNNPLIGFFKKYNADAYNLGASTNLRYEVFKDLVITTMVGYSKVQRTELSTNPLSATDPSQALTANNRTANYYDSSNQTINIEPQISWTQNIAAGKLNVLIGTTLQNNETHNQLIQGTGYINDGLLENIAAASTTNVRSAYTSVYRYLSIYARLNYSLQEKYFINITGRRDGSSRFGPASRYGNFGAVGAAWIFSNDDFVKNKLSFLSFGKLRVSYGLTGNDQVGDYNYLENWSPAANPYQGTAALTLGRIFNPNFEWETNKKAEISLQLGFFEDKFKLTSTYFRNRSSNQLVFAPLSPSVGFPGVLRNLPATIQNTGLELELSTNPIQNKNFKWSISANLSIPRNKLVSFPGIEKTASYAELYIVGQPLSIIKTLESTGVNPSTGQYTFTDFDGSGTISTPGDLQRFKILGQKYSGGLQNTFTYKNFELNLNFQFVNQLGRNAITNNAPGSLNNQPDIVLRRWQNPGDITDIQKYTAGASALTHTYANAFGDLGIGNSSFLKLKNAAISYQMPGKILKTIRAKNAKVYLQGQNLFTITHYLGLDPESLNLTPALRMLTAGFQLTF